MDDNNLIIPSLSYCWTAIDQMRCLGDDDFSTVFFTICNVRQECDLSAAGLPWLGQLVLDSLHPAAGVTVCIRSVCHIVLVSQWQTN